MKIEPTHIHTQTHTAIVRKRRDSMDVKIFTTK